MLTYENVYLEYFNGLLWVFSVKIQLVVKHVKVELNFKEWFIRTLIKV